MTHDIHQFFIGIAVAIGGKIMGMIAAAGDLVPENWWQAGATVILVGGLSFACFHLWKALRIESQARITDRDDFTEFMKNEVSKAEASREKLYGVLQENSKVIGELSNKIQANGNTRPIKIHSDEL